MSQSTREHFVFSKLILIERCFVIHRCLAQIEALVDEALKGPKRIRPPRIEELQNEVRYGDIINSLIYTNNNDETFHIYFSSSQIAQLKQDKLRLEKSVELLKKGAAGAPVSTAR